jgi:hypothetical protein
MLDLLLWAEAQPYVLDAAAELNAQMNLSVNDLNASNSMNVSELSRALFDILMERLALDSSISVGTQARDEDWNTGAS